MRSSDPNRGGEEGEGRVLPNDIQIIKRRNHVLLLGKHYNEVHILTSCRGFATGLRRCLLGVRGKKYKCAT